MDNEERARRMAFAQAASARAAKEAASAREELGASITRRMMAEPAPDPMTRWRERAEADERAVVRARARMRAEERRETAQARAESVAQVEHRIRSELTEMFERRLSEETVRVLQAIGEHVLPILEKQADRIGEMARTTARHEERLALMVGHALARDGEILPAAPGPLPKPRRPVARAVN